MNTVFTVKERSKSRIAACFVVIALLLCLLLSALSSCSLFSSEMTIKKLDIVVDLSQDGVATFTETSRVEFTEQDSTWWNYYRIIDDPNLLAMMSEENSDAFQVIADSFRLDGEEITFAGAVDLEPENAKTMALSTYHSSVGYFFARPDQGVEIGVIMPEFRKGTHTISYSYSIKRTITEVADAAVFYYQFLSENNTLPVEKLSVTVNFPKEEKGVEAWLHTNGDSIGVCKTASDKRSVRIEVEDVSAKEYVETRMLLSKKNYEAGKVDKTVTSVDIEEEEKVWEEDYRSKQRAILAVTILDYVLAVLAAASGVLVVLLLKKRYRPIDLPGKPLYYREIPEGYSGGEVSPLYFYYSNENYLDESISATMLELVRLGYITITPDEGKKSAVVTVLKQDENDDLRTHQKYVVEMLLTVKPLGTPFTMKEFEEFGRTHPQRMSHIVEKYKAAILNKSQRDRAYHKDNRTHAAVRKYFTAMVAVGVAVVTVSGFTSFYGLPGMFFFGAGLLLGGLIAFFFSKKIKMPLTLTGQKEYDKLHALSRYMQEFSLMKEHEIPALVLWEDYMIFATAMGIADKVAEQLEIAYPEFREMKTSGFGATDFIILYYFSPSFRLLTGLNFVGNVANVIRSVSIADRAARAARLAGKMGGVGGGRGGSSFHGGGGGFRGGGFGGRR